MVNGANGVRRMAGKLAFRLLSEVVLAGFPKINFNSGSYERSGALLLVGKCACTHYKCYG